MILLLWPKNLQLVCMATHNAIYIYYYSQNEQEIQRKVDSKMKAAASRRNEILSQKSRAAKKEGKRVLTRF